MPALDANCCATVDAFDGSSCVSPWTSLSRGLFFGLRFQTSTKYCAQWSWSLPMEPAGPVIGASMPICTVPQPADLAAGLATADVATTAAVTAATSPTAPTLLNFDTGPPLGIAPI